MRFTAVVTKEGQWYVEGTCLMRFKSSFAGLIPATGLAGKYP